MTTDGTFDTLTVNGATSLKGKTCIQDELHVEHLDLPTTEILLAPNSDICTIQATKFIPSIPTGGLHPGAGGGGLHSGSGGNTLGSGAGIQPGDSGGIQPGDSGKILPFSLSLQPDGGNIGIGTNNPTNKLHVAAAGGFPNNVPIVAQSQSTFLGALDPNGNERFGLNLDPDGHSYRVKFYDKYDGSWHHSITLVNGNVGIITTDPKAALDVDGDVMVSGDVILQNADFAEDFDILESVEIESGTVMVLTESGGLKPSTEAYDKRVAGVISGAGAYKPAIILDRQPNPSNRRPIALVGKVFCKVDAQYAPIEIGDLLTSSSTPGHAMKASDPLKAFGAVIGKALKPLKSGTGMIPIIVALQ